MNVLWRVFYNGWMVVDVVDLWVAMKQCRNGLSFILTKSLVLFICLIIQVYRYFITWFLGRSCRFLPTCSEYANESVIRHGPWAGVWLSLFRLFSCNPCGESGFDPVPINLSDDSLWWKPWTYRRGVCAVDKGTDNE